MEPSEEPVCIACGYSLEVVRFTLKKNGKRYEQKWCGNVYCKIPPNYGVKEIKEEKSDGKKD